MVGRLLARDVVVVLATAGLWAAEARLRDDAGALALGVAITAAFMAALCGYLVHEWGHLLATWASGGRAHVAPRVLSVFLFKFDSGHNTRRQFLWMGMGGFLASAVAVVFFAVVLPLDALSGKVAMTLVALGVLATFVLELPPFFRVLRGAPLPRGIAYESSEP